MLTMEQTVPHVDKWAHCTPCSEWNTLYTMLTMEHTVHLVDNWTPCTPYWQWNTLYTMLTMEHPLYHVDNGTPCTPCWQWNTLHTMLTMKHPVHHVDNGTPCTQCWQWNTLYTMLTARKVLQKLKQHFIPRGLWLPRGIAGNLSNLIGRARLLINLSALFVCSPGLFIELINNPLKAPPHVQPPLGYHSGTE